MERLHYNGRDYRLERRPPVRDQALRAWDAADEYLLAELPAPAGRTLLVNDAFGALAVALCDRRPVLWSDSHLARLALRDNLARNGLSPDAVAFVPADEAPAGPFDVVAAKFPKSLAFWEDMLLRLRPLLHDGSQVLAGGMIKHTPARAYRLMETILGETRTSLGRKKARLAVARLDPDRALPDRLADTEYPLPGTDLTLRNGPNVFAREHLDVGTRCLLAHLPAAAGELRAADLGCGNGAVSLALAARNPRAEILGVDESYQAVACARANAERAGLDPARVAFAVGDGLEDTAADSLDLVVVNPPFHQAQALGDVVAWSMFMHARRTLCDGGRLLVVGNRHLGYGAKLARLFGNCRTLATEPKFVVLEAVRRFGEGADML
ncbi:MAG TPA: methyltransferase [Candidatus Krumholzibacteria bacterium]|nr:methyltransferase [Candidatus Krumholzibacteria bacterium]HPD72515.1 methyltransferase [Candidatus Krumholzibacteria bacterium]HRY40553.1 methyltransferase [Candidatus Krumholzibacteria bacterium]